jgi:2-polyprenyl-6-hydroxyphenyl methylase/3-demethylubiquinone-9 3-methyltransferase
MKSPSINPSEVEKFSAIADEWWDEGGKFAPLHQFNPVRIGYLKEKIIAHYGRLEGLSVLDIGCGGGLLCEPFTRLKANVTGIDASEKNIAVASTHARQMQLAIDYRATSAEALAATSTQYDVVLAMEIIEHVADVESFLHSVCALVKPGGLVFIATMNRTVKSYMLAIVGAEYILRWLPRGTHDWKKFLRPSEIAAPLREQGVNVLDVQGISFSPLSKTWSRTGDTGVNYIMYGHKASE